jgi:hypothetical protein
MKYLIILLLIALIGCTVNPGTVPSEPANFDFTGEWGGSFIGLSGNPYFKLEATQNEKEIAGTLRSGINMFSVDGSVGGDNISLTATSLSDSSYKIYCYGTIDGDSASGNWDDVVFQDGTWFADRL